MGRFYGSESSDYDTLYAHRVRAEKSPVTSDFLRFFKDWRDC